MGDKVDTKSGYMDLITNFSKTFIINEYSYKFLAFEEYKNRKIKYQTGFYNDVIF